MRVRNAEIGKISGETLDSIKRKNRIFSITLSNIKPAERFKHKGDVIVQGDIGEGSSLTINNGMLVIEGTVGNNVRIHLNHEPLFSNGITYCGDLTIEGVKEPANKAIHIKGCVGDNVTIHLLGDLSVDGNIGNNCKLTSENGKITIHGSQGENNIIKNNSNSASNIIAKNGLGGITHTTESKMPAQNKNNGGEKTPECRLF